MPSCCGGELDRAGDQTKTTLPMGVYPLGVYNVFSWGSLLKAQGPPWSTASVNITPFCVDAGQPILKDCLEFTLLVTSFL
jgi:hypothetical protein